MRLLGFVVAIVALASAGCGGGGGGVGAGSGGDRSDELIGRTFLSTGATQDGQPRELVAGTKVSLWFADDGRLVANAGCNTIGGQIGTGDGKLTTDGSLSVTDMGCDAPRHEQDEWLVGLLQSGPSWRLDGDELIVTGGGAELTLLDREVAEPDQPVEGTKWVLDTIFSGETAASVPAGAEGAFLEFANGRVSGSTGCNSLEGAATISGTQIEFGQLTMTRKACQDGLMSVEQAMTAVLQGTVPFEIESGQLRLAPDAEQGLGFRA